MGVWLPTFSSQASRTRPFSHTAVYLVQKSRPPRQSHRFIPRVFFTRTSSPRIYSSRKLSTSKFPISRVSNSRRMARCSLMARTASSAGSTAPVRIPSNVNYCRPNSKAWPSLHVPPTEGITVCNTLYAPRPLGASRSLRRILFMDDYSHDLKRQLPRAVMRGTGRVRAAIETGAVCISSTSY